MLMTRLPTPSHSQHASPASEDAQQKAPDSEGTPQEHKELHSCSKEEAGDARFSFPGHRPKKATEDGEPWQDMALHQEQLLLGSVSVADYVLLSRLN